MRTASLVVASGLGALVLTASSPGLASDQIAGSLTLTANVSNRRSLTVSRDVLRFEVSEPGREVLAEVEFSAAVRTREGGDVLLTVELVRGINRLDGAATFGAALTFRGEGEGTLAGALHSSSPVATARWQGSGRRVGRVRFALRASVAGNYTVPVRFTLSAP